MNARLLIYGATGYTGKLIAHRAREVGLDFAVGGRNADRVTALADELGVPAVVFPVDDEHALGTGLEGFSVALNVAGPFSATAGPMMRACVRAGAHYLDSTAEYAVFALAESLGDAAAAAGVMLLPGAGWDVVPSDCVAAHAARRVDRPRTLRIGLKLYRGPDPDEAFAGGSMFSRGSLASNGSIVDLGALVRADGRITALPGPTSVDLDYGDGPESSVLLPMGDLITSWRSTSVPNIEVYFENARALPSPDGDLADLPDGPTEAQRALGRSRVAAEVVGDDGGVVRSYVDTPTGYGFTRLSTVEIARRVLAGDFAPGFQSPASAYGPELVATIADSHVVDL
ncbi:saccharopine dehydrogenase family protein [Umezawaea endophytica]|uniref:Saccharopine dehydrogenase NADP-binding domain-containing protein n=1 Tax=Umezawaea endophytica TaxID=1654476 RepID=A0A9X2VFL2_9PSEU|nr:saccharopine dehydrogenase NADP-binding domain-containing protein [Umezawaea endophytica]MCS7475765.1 saccharopine dehydrogenase NADP-binding domain-containing protein [Umezawaea endophytica]